MDFLKIQKLLSSEITKTLMIEAGFKRRTLETARKLGVDWRQLCFLAMQHGNVLNDILDQLFEKRS
jgi:hypothetical protein